MEDQNMTAGGTFWENDFNSENVVDYALAAREMAVYLRVLFAEGYDSVIVPSRGAWPLLEAAKAAWRLEEQEIRRQNAVKGLSWESLLSPLSHSLILPFSADPYSDAESSGAIRRYWAQVLNAIVRREGSAPQLVGYKAVIENLARKSWVDAMPTILPGEKFLFIDTVISGRAICEIVSAFAELGLNQCHYLLIADRSGRAIKPEYRQIIDSLRGENRCTLVPINNLFTEDRGPAVSGIWSTVYPQIHQRMREKYSWASNAYGAGSFYHKVSSSQVGLNRGIGTADYNMPVTRLYADFSVGLHSVLVDMHRIDSSRRDRQIPAEARIDPAKLSASEQVIWEDMERDLKYRLQETRHTAARFERHTPLDQETTRILAEPRIHEVHPLAIVGATGSHLVRVTFPEDVLSNQMRAIEDAIKCGENVFSDGYFRNTT